MTRAFLILSLALAPFLSQHGEEPREPVPAPHADTFDRYHQGIFFAVLEGLYRDGVASETARAIVERDELSGYPIAFVQGCPICMPALDAFQLYLARPRFVSLKVPADTFGAGLPEGLAQRLTRPDRAERRSALRELVETWVGDWLERQRLDPLERSEWERALAARAEKGMAMLADMQRTGLGLYGDFDECPLCAGAEAGSAVD